jgi:hypothetical protein
MSDYKMPRQEFRAEIQELVISARPDVDISLHDIRYHLDKLEEILFGLRGVKDKPPDVFDEYLGKIS